MTPDPKALELVERLKAEAKRKDLTFGVAAERTLEGQAAALLAAQAAEIAELREVVEKIGAPGNGSHWGRLAREALARLEKQGGEDA